MAQRCVVTPIVSSGSVTLLVRDADGRPERAMEADETLYLHPTRTATPEKSLLPAYLGRCASRTARNSLVSLHAGHSSPAASRAPMW